MYLQCNEPQNVDQIPCSFGSSYEFLQSFSYKECLCAVPENYPTPPTEGIGISRGVGHSLRPNHCTCTTEVEGLGEKNPHHGGDLYRYFLDLRNGVLFILIIFRIRLKTAKLNLSAILTVTILVCLQYYTSWCSSVFSTVTGFISSLCFEMHFQINFELCEGDRCQIVTNE